MILFGIKMNKISKFIYLFQFRGKIRVGITERGSSGRNYGIGIARLGGLQVTH